LAGGDPPFAYWLFSRRFAAQAFTGFNPDYVLGIGDTVLVRLWGGAEFDGQLPIDGQGNVFLPRLGPVRIAGLRAGDLAANLNREVQRVYERNVQLYATLLATPQVKVFVTGFVRQPGLYAGNSGDSPLFFLDQAQGILPGQGAYTAVQVLRAGQAVAEIDLYRFVEEGKMPALQLRDGDVVLVPARGAYATVRGLVQTPSTVELAGRGTVGAVLGLLRPLPTATHVRISRAGGVVARVDYLGLAEAAAAPLETGDLVEVVSDRRDGMIAVRVEGEHDSPQEYVVPVGTKLGAILDRIVFTGRSDRQALSLRRIGVRLKQKERINMLLQSVEQSVLNVRSNTAEEAALRTQEAALIRQWIDRARQVEPRGQVVIAGNPRAADMALENGDVVFIPRHDDVVLVHGEVLVSGACLFDPAMDPDDYIARCGGRVQDGGGTEVILMHSDGSFSRPNARPVGGPQRGRQTAYRQDYDPGVRPGDEILVLPTYDAKGVQVTKDIIQVIYQIALSASVVLAI
jgi:protein involved in polysaccharide export with SLBB domain